MQIFNVVQFLLLVNRDTQIESFGKLKEIMRHVYINSDDIEDKLKDVLICGDVINYEMDYLED